MFLNIQNQKRSWTVSTIGHIDCLKEHLKCRSTKVEIDTKTLFITYGKPFTAAVIISMRRWVKDLFIGTFFLKNTHHQLNVDIAEILKQDCWKNAKTFFNFYKKDIVYYAPEDVDFMSILTRNIYDHMLFIFTISACKAKCIYIYSAHLICLTCSMHNFNRPIRKFWSKY